MGEFTIRPYRQKRLRSYYAQMSKDNNHVLVDDNVKAVLNAQGFHTDESPRSIYSVEKLFEALQNYAPGKVPNPKPSHFYDVGISLAYSCFARKSGEEIMRVLPMTPETVVKITSNPGGSPGLTNYGCSKADSQTRALERGLQILHKQKQPEPCLAFKRTQFEGKTRLVWGFPYSMTLIEGLVARNLVEKFKGGRTPMSIGLTTGHLGSKLRVSSYHKRYFYSLDMSQFDSTLSAGLIHQAFNIIRTWYDLDEIEPISGVSVRDIFSIIERYFIHTTIVMPDGKIYIGKDHGCPSGSYFTQIVDSIIQVIVAGMVSERFHLYVSKNDIYVVGDDLGFWTNRYVNLDDIAKFVNENLGLKLHGSEKSSISRFDEPIHYLGRTWVNGLPTLDEDQILKRMIYPESFRKYSKSEVERKRQVHMLLLSYAAVYKAAWRIAYRAINENDSNIGNGSATTDVNVYLRESTSRDRRIDPKWQSGLQRYLMTYHPQVQGGDIPITAYQFWL